MEKHLRIQIAGPSGVGKTTLAKDISDIYGIPYVSGSYSDLIPSTKDILHSDMISMDPKEIYQNDFQLLNLRKLWDREFFGDMFNLVNEYLYTSYICTILKELF